MGSMAMCWASCSIRCRFMHACTPPSPPCAQPSLTHDLKHAHAFASCRHGSFKALCNEHEDLAGHRRHGTAAVQAPPSEPQAGP